MISRNRLREFIHRTADGGSVATEVVLLTPVLIAILMFVGVVIHRGVHSRLLVNSAAHHSARAATLARTPATAMSAANATATSTLVSGGVTCASFTVDVDLDSLRPGGNVTVTVSCDVDLSQALMLGVPSTRRLTARASEPIDTWRSIPDGGRP